MITLGVKVTRKNRIPELRKALRPRAGRAINAWARAVLDVSQQLAPVDKGILKGSGKIINYAGTVGDGRQKGVAKSIVYLAPHAIFQEFGTSEMQAQPFLFPAYDQAKPQLIAALSEIFKL